MNFYFSRKCKTSQIVNQLAVKPVYNDYSGLQTVTIVDKWSLYMQSHSVITNSLGLAIFVRYNLANLFTIMTNLHLKKCSLTTEFVITEFHCFFTHAISMESETQNSSRC